MFKDTMVHIAVPAGTIFGVVLGGHGALQIANQGGQAKTREICKIAAGIGIIGVHYIIETQVLE